MPAGFRVISTWGCWERVWKGSGEEKVYKCQLGLGSLAHGDVGRGCGRVLVRRRCTVSVVGDEGYTVKKGEKFGYYFVRLRFGIWADFVLEV
nr:hypothetical protein [Tanacetum cinerariifolium]